MKVGINVSWGEVTDAVSGREVTSEDIAPMVESVRRYLPWLDTATGRFEMRIDGWSRGGHGILGAYPRDPRVLLSVASLGLTSRTSILLASECFAPRSSDRITRRGTVFAC